MAMSFRGRTTELGVVSRKWKETSEISPERNKVWIEPSIIQRKVAVVYYLSRNGHLQHPHFMEVPLSSNTGLYLKDVINRINLLRGKGMANQYSWSSKRSYKNGFVWHDLAENDFIYPSHGQEYVLKGTEILDHSISPQSLDVTSPEKSDKDHDFQSMGRRRDSPRSSTDLREYKVYTAESSSDSSGRLAADALTRTDDKKRRKMPVVKEPKIEKLQSPSQESELSREDISPPPLDSSSETLESLMKADTRRTLSNGDGNKEDNLNRSGRMRASAVLMQLISCGSVSVKECVANSERRDQRFSLIRQYKSRLPPGAGNCSHERKEYFSGSLVETKKEEAPNLSKSSSCNPQR
ncbi:transcription factor MYB59-like [Hibiscus syriacus]|uniref:Transcription factor MYB59-like n=1 Tax=Hibiscus syriacus TaxID=106335 RepID=A0A6A2X7E9_HIBSY|nr:protein UPSTREAM OF FLC-like [Hibiscus syriacus]KAE8664990.1 transcription factor MYB59-like [Hibiscus syriacus]